MQGPRLEAVNTGPKPRPMVTVDSTKATKRTEDFSVPVEAMFVADVVEEHARVLAEAERRMKREELLDGDDASTAFDAAKFAANGPQACRNETWANPIFPMFGAINLLTMSVPPLQQLVWVSSASLAQVDIITAGKLGVVTRPVGRKWEQLAPSVYFT